MLKLDLQLYVVSLIKPENYFNRRSDYRTFSPYKLCSAMSGSGDYSGHLVTANIAAE